MSDLVPVDLHAHAVRRAEGMKSDIEGDFPEHAPADYDLWHNGEDEIYIDFGDLCSPVLCFKDPKTGQIDDDHVMEIPQYVKNPWYREPVGRRPR